MVAQQIRPDLMIFDKQERELAVVEVSAIADGSAEARSRLQAYLSEARCPVAYALFADLTTVRIFRVNAGRLEEEVAALPMEEIATPYDAEFTSKRIFHDYLAEIISAWLDDVAYHWKFSEPPGGDTLRAIGFAQSLTGGRTVREYNLDA